MTTSCPTCRAETPDGAHFCPACGARLEEPLSAASERRVVSTLFADLVGYTALSERSDPEDVDLLLRAFYQMARATIERFGGSVEKYIGDAVVGLFGAPTAHEDDAERAVRAGLEIVAAMPRLPELAGEHPQVRVGVNSGRALVRLGVVPGSDEPRLVGDTVNTAARLLAAAPPQGVVAGALAHKLTERAIFYEDMQPAGVKGKRAPVERWLAIAPVSRLGLDPRPRVAAPMIGREVELATLDGLLARAMASATPQFALVSGEAGIGKSRLVNEFLRLVDERAEFFVHWRQGRCPPYGEGLAYWALREIVSAHAGILQTDEPAVVEEKLARALPNAEDQWLRVRLRPLVGLPAPQADREENFAAWLRFLESIARRIPTVLVVEDIHWASEPTLAFFGHVARHAAAVPLLVIATARPEFLDAHDGLASFGDGLTLVDLKALNPEESTRLARRLPAVAGLVEVADAVAERCGGNPLFAEELAWSLSERGVAAAPADDQAAPPRAVRPDVIATLMAARLDALPEVQRNVLADASVVGQVFWPGAVAAIGGTSPPDVAAALDRLEAREFVRRRGESTHSGETEYAFWHALMRDVAYEQLPRSSRARKHGAAADWIDAAGDALVAEIPDVLAHHRCTALELARSSRQEDLAATLLEPAIAALSRAGDNAMGLDIAAAGQHYSRALELTPEGDTLRPGLLVRRANALGRSGDVRLALETYSEAIDGLRSLGDNRTAAVALAESSNLFYERLDELHAASFSEQALDLLEGEGACPELVRVLEQRAYMSEAAGDCATAFEQATRALAVARDLGLPESARALMRCGIARCDSGHESEALDYLRRALRAAEQTGATAELSAAHACLGMTTLVFRGPHEARVIYHDGSETARGRYDLLGQIMLTNMEAEALLFSGAWDETLTMCGKLEAWLAGHDVSSELWATLELRAALMALRGDERLDEALRFVRDDDAATRGTDRVALTVAAIVCQATGEDEEARLHLERLTRGPHSLGNQPIFALWWPLALRTALRADSVDLARRLGRAVPPSLAAIPHSSATVAGLLQEAEGDHAAALASFGRAAAAWHDIEVPFEEAEARFGLGRCLAALQRPAEARAALAEARELFARLRARPALAETDALLAGLHSVPTGDARHEGGRASDASPRGD